MPYYDWKCELCSVKVGVLRAFTDYDSVPGSDETDKIPEPRCTGNEQGIHTWTRHIIGKPTVHLWPTSGGPGKGRW